MRRLIAFSCGGVPLIGTIDAAAGSTGLLIVSGGNEIRSGAHRGMALLAQRLATTGTPVLRYDRRGVGDSGGEIGGNLLARDDLVAAAAAFRAHCPAIDRIVGFGNCDAASALALFGRTAGIASIVMANPWLADEPDALPPEAAIRAHYRDRLRDPATWRRALSGGIDIRKLAAGLRKIAIRSAPPRPAEDLIDAIGDWGGDVRIVLADGDATAIAFADAARRRGLTMPMTVIATSSHSFARDGDGAALEAAIRAAL